jgi:hypothetical protein
MRISRTNLPPAAFNDTNSRPANVPTAVEERAALRRLKAMGERAGNPDDANWESHFFLAPNVRFTRTPDRDVTAAQPAASESAQGEKQRDHSDQTPSVEQLREVLSTMMILQGGMDMGTAGADALPAQPINDNANPVAPAMGAAVVPAAVQPAKPSTAFAQLSDFAFWESMDFAAESEPPFKIEQISQLRKVQGECRASGKRAGGFRHQGRDHPCPPRPCRHAL